MKKAFERVEFERVTPESVGISSEGVLRLIDALEGGHTEMHGLMIMRHGKVCAEGWWAPYAPGMHHMCASLTKTYMGTAIGIAIREGTDPVIIKYLSNCFEAAAAQEDVIAKAEEMQITALSMGTEKCNELFHEQNEILLDLWEVNPWN